MLRIFDSIFTEYVAHLRFRDIPPAYNVEYRKWLRYYLDFRNKYPVPNSKAERVRLFCDKLRKKRQTDAQRERAAHAVSAVSGRQAADETDDRGCEGAPFIPGGKTALTQNRAFSKAEGGRLKGKTMRDHTKLRAFELADEVVLIVYQITAKFPKKEQHGLTSQIRGAAVSVPSNIEEGFTRESQADYLRLLTMAFGSLREMRYQLGLSHRLDFLSIQEWPLIEFKIEEAEKIMNSLIRSLR